jgi:hypothetical protein
MDRQQFYFLYANLNSIAELGLREALIDALAEPVAEPAVENLSQDELDARVLAGFDNLDFSALDAVTSDGEPLVREEGALLPGDVSEPFELERYLVNAYAAEERVRERVDEHYRRVDVLALTAALAQLPANLPALTTPLAAGDMARWVEFYRNGDPTLRDLVLQIRRLDA